jgi:hypothetical protein
MTCHHTKFRYPNELGSHAKIRKGSLKRPALIELAGAFYSQVSILSERDKIKRIFFFLIENAEKSSRVAILAKRDYDSTCLLKPHKTGLDGKNFMCLFKSKESID